MKDLILNMKTHHIRELMKAAKEAGIEVYVSVPTLMN
jgi:predicted peroxiredoxin